MGVTAERSADVVSSTRRLGHVPALDGLRGVAILLVVAFHADLLPGGRLGVNLFFVLSGFLITSLLLRAHALGGIRLSRFYQRRALRLLPALTLLLVVWLLLTVAAGVPERGLATLGLGLGYGMNMAVSAGYDPGAFIHLWSLAQEEQFYLLWPPLLLFLLHRRVRPTAIGVGLLVAAAAFTGWRALLEARGVTGPRLWVAPDMNAAPILFGCAAAFAYTFIPRLRAATPALVVLPAALLMLGSRWAPGYGLALNIAAALFAVILLGVATSPVLAWPLEFRPLCWVGKVSYGLYLWHLPLFAAFGWKAGLPVALVVSLLSWRYVEQPFLRRKDRPPRASSLAPAASPTY